MFKLKIIFYWLRYALRGTFRSREALEAFQHKQLRRFARKSLAKSPFYQHLNIQNVLDWPRIPLMDKPTMLDHFDQLNILHLPKEEALQFAIEAEQKRDFSPEINGITIGLSTGTSGKRGVFLVSKTERAQWVAMVMTRVLKPSFFRQQKVAFFLRANSNLYSSVQSKLFAFRFFDILKPVPALIDELLELQPDVLAGQPSILLEICRLLLEKKSTWRPKQAISFAEVLTKADKQRIESVLGIPLQEVYQCTEGFLACTCPHGTMHLNEDIVYIEKEFIDEERFYPIITDFTRSTQLMVRYRLDDILVVKKDGCPCGSAALALGRIEGRSNEVLFFENKKGDQVPLYPDILARKIAWQGDDFHTYQIRQISENQLAINIHCATEVWAKNAQMFESILRQWMTENQIDDMGIDFQLGRDIVHTPGSKFRNIERLF